MSTTYSQLIDSIKQYSGRTDAATISAIPAFITAAQTKLDSILRLPHMLESVTTEAGPVSIPLEFMELESVVIGEFAGVMHSYADVLAARKRSPHQHGMMYAINAAALEIAFPARVTLTGYEKPDRLSESTQENAYTRNAENALLWLSLGYLGTFARDEDAAQAWAAMGAAEVENINAAYDKYRMGAPIVNTAHARMF